MYFTRVEQKELTPSLNLRSCYYSVICGSSPQEHTAGCPSTSSGHFMQGWVFRFFSSRRLMANCTFVSTYTVYIHLYTKKKKGVDVAASLRRGSRGPFLFSCWEMPFPVPQLPLLTLPANTQKPTDKARPGHPITLCRPPFANDGLTGQLPIWPVTFVEH